MIFLAMAPLCAAEGRVAEKRGDGRRHADGELVPGRHQCQSSRSMTADGVAASSSKRGVEIEIEVRERVLDVASTRSAATAAPSMRAHHSRGESSAGSSGKL